MYVAGKAQCVEETATGMEQNLEASSQEHQPEGITVPPHVTMERVLEELSKVAFQPADDGSGSSMKYTSKLRALELLAKHLEEFRRGQEEERYEDDPVTRSIKEAMEGGLF